MKSFKQFASSNESLWANIHKKRKSGKKMRKPGEKGAPPAQDFKNARGENVEEGQMVTTEIDAMKKLFGTMQKQVMNMPSNQRLIQLNRVGKMYGMSFDNTKQAKNRLYVKTK